MKAYADTNFFISLFCPGPHAVEARRLHSNAIEASQSYPVTILGRLEFVNALQQVVFSTRHGVPGVTSTPEMALAIEAMFFEQVNKGQRFRSTTVIETALEKQFQALSHRHTAKEGFRTYDILHVSSALVLGCDTFWSFDAKAKKLAKLEGLAVN